MSIEVLEKPSGLGVATERTPRPRFLGMKGPSESEGEPFFGFEAMSPIDGEEKLFSWWGNIFGLDLTEEKRHAETAEYLTRLMIHEKMGIVMGPAISPDDVEVGKLSVISERWGLSACGVYLEASGRRKSEFSFRGSADGLASEEELRMSLRSKGKPNVFDEILERVKSSLSKLQISLQRK